MVALLLMPHLGEGQIGGGLQAAESPETRTAALFESMSNYNAEDLRGFFPERGAWSYQRTVHTRSGDHRGVWRVPAGQTSDVLRGELRRAFFGSMHAQPIGWFTHPVANRGRDWKKVSPTRLVPRDASSSSPVFIQWRREGEAWVIDAVGDESFDEGVPLPSWCC